MDRAKLGEGVDDIVSAVAAEVPVFAFVKYFHFGRSVGLGKNGGALLFLFKGNAGLGSENMPAAGATELFAGFGKAVINRLPPQERLVSTTGANDFNRFHGRNA